MTGRFHLLAIALSLALPRPLPAPANLEECVKYTQLLLPFPDEKRPPALEKPASPPRVVDESSRDFYTVKDTEHEDFYISASVSPEGTLQLGMQTILPNGRRSVLVAKDHFPKILEHFKGRFQRIRGQWQTGHDLTTNLDQFNLACRTRDRTLEEAAAMTWTGKQAAAHGYTKVKILELVGRRGNYTKVLVTFERPDPVSPR